MRDRYNKVVLNSIPRVVPALATHRRNGGQTHIMHVRLRQLRHRHTKTEGPCTTRPHGYWAAPAHQTSWRWQMLRAPSLRVTGRRIWLVSCVTWRFAHPTLDGAFAGAIR